MKLDYKILLVFLILQGCDNITGGVNQFSAANDTLVIRTQKQKGEGLLLLGAGALNFKDATEAFPYPVVIPKKLKEVKRAQFVVDFKAENLHYVDIIEGIKGTEKVFIVDQNNNNDLTDDSVRVYKKIKWGSWNESIKCEFLISNGHEIIRDSSWIRIGTYKERTWYGRYDQLTAKFSIDEDQFKVGVIDPLAVTTFTYGFTPEIALLSINEVMKDTLLKVDLLKKNEFLKLNNQYYRFEDISTYGDYITLIKERDFDKKIGTQLGMIAPDFECISVNGKIINSAQLNDKITIVANSCGCGGDKLSTKAFFDIKEAYGHKIHIVRLDSHIEEGLDGIHVDMQNEFNKDMYNKYRQVYCSRTAYVIGKNKRIIDKFPITDWKSSLTKKSGNL
ncbi:hypothetical protein QQ020_35805 [Fulvivirgaceae bacterium BMA12]|uniref:Lipoprotein n=1 Tax=Agaribacillus aureus TaxID=3051825 RepID=A0ABT8LJ13_9BACT|nr:hypothetical protein [Fulvivirgaceae bacterium BMA12]